MYPIKFFWKRSWISHTKMSLFSAQKRVCLITEESLSFPNGSFCSMSQDVLDSHQHIKLFNFLTVLVGSYNSVALPNCIKAVRFVIVLMLRKVLFCLIPLGEKKNELLVKLWYLLWYYVCKENRKKEMKEYWQILFASVHVAAWEK